MGCFLQSTFGKYLLVETKDRDGETTTELVDTKDREGEEAEQMPNKYGTGYDDHHRDYPEDWGLDWGKGFDYASGKKKRDPYAFGLGK